MANPAPDNSMVCKNYLSQAYEGLIHHEFLELEVKKPLTLVQKIKDLFSDTGIHLHRT